MESFKADGAKLNYCSECKKDVDRIVRIGEEFYINKETHSWTAQVCKDCLKKALELIKEK